MIEELFMEQLSHYKVELYWIRNKSNEDKKILIYCRIFLIDTNSYINQDLDEAEEIWLTEAKLVSLIIQKRIFSLDQLNKFRKSLSTGKFDPKYFDLDESFLGTDLRLRPEIVQFDKESLNCENPPIPPESGVNTIAFVESYWPENKLDLLNSALEIKKSDNEKYDKNMECVFKDDFEFENRLNNLLLELKKHSGLSFDGPYSERLGNIEFFEIPFNTHLGQIPFSIETDRELYPDDDPIAKGIIVKSNFSKKDDHTYWINVILYNNNEVLQDSLVLLKSGDDVHVEAKEPITQYEVKVFSANAVKNIIYHERRVIGRVLIGMGRVFSGTKRITDRLSENLNQQKKSIGRKLEESSSFSHTSFKSGGYQNDPWVPEARSIRQFVLDRVIQPLKSRWFLKGSTERAESLVYIRSIIDNSRNSAVYIADPFFDDTAFGLLIPRLRHFGLPVTVITSCLGLHTDLESLSDKQHDQAKISKMQRLRIESWCKKNSVLIAVKLRILDIAAGENGLKQAFHDRYIACVREGRTIVFSLSNSLNKLAGNYPCCITELEPQIGNKIFKYIRGLEKGLDISKEKNDDSRKLKPKVIWDMQIAREERHKMNTTTRVSKESRIVGFPGWQTLISFMLDVKEITDNKLIEKAKDAGFLHSESESELNWKTPDCFAELISKTFARFPNDLEFQSDFFAALGEYRARTNAGDVIDREVTGHLNNNIETIDVLNILERVKLFYETKLPPNGLKGLPPSIEELSLENYLKSGSKSKDDDMCVDPLELMRNAERLQDSPYIFGVTGLYGLKWTIKIFFTVCAKKVLDWIEIDNNRTAQCNAAIVKALVDAIECNQSSQFLHSLINSNNIFISMFGIAGLYYKKSKHRRISMSETQSFVISELRRVEIAEEDILWMSGLQLTDAQSSIFRAIDQNGENSHEAKAAKDDFDKLLKTSGELLGKSSPNQKQLNRLNSAIRHLTKDRFTIAEYAENHQDMKNNKSWLVLYKQCVEDVDTLIGKLGSKKFHFHSRSDFDMLVAAAKAFVRLNEGKSLKRVRNKYRNYLERLALVASDPLAPTKNYHEWNESLGRAAAGLLFVIYVCRESSPSDEDKYLPIALRWITRAVCQLFLGAKKGWFDIAGLLDRLAQENAWSISSVEDPENSEVACRSAKDERLPLFFRACMCIMPESVFKNETALALRLSSKVLNQSPEDPKNTNQYFYLLDYIIGNGFRTDIDKGIVNNAIEHGLEKCPNLNKPWPTFYQIAWDALSKKETEKEIILKDPTMSKSYVAYVLREVLKNV
jgi:hypothetical protein